ncbi:hypothetical protein Tco_0930289 [Tanacetum coccineum]
MPFRCRDLKVEVVGVGGISWVGLDVSASVLSVWAGMFSATCSMVVLEVSVGMLVRLVAVSCSWDTCVWGGASSGRASGHFAVLLILKWIWNVWVIPSNSLRDGDSW